MSEHDEWVEEIRDDLDTCAHREYNGNCWPCAGKALLDAYDDMRAERDRLRAEVRTQHKSGCCRTRWGNDPCAFCENATNVCACQDCITPPVGEDTP